MKVEGSTDAHEGSAAVIKAQHMGRCDAALPVRPQSMSHIPCVRARNFPYFLQDASNLPLLMQTIVV